MLRLTSSQSAALFALNLADKIVYYTDVKRGKQFLLTLISFMLIDILKRSWNIRSIYVLEILHWEKVLPVKSKLGVSEALSGLDAHITRRIQGKMRVSRTRNAENEICLALCTHLQECI